MKLRRYTKTAKYVFSRDESLQVINHDFKINLHYPTNLYPQLTSKAPEPQNIYDSDIFIVNCSPK